MFSLFFFTFRKSFMSFGFYTQLLSWPFKRVVFYFLSLSSVLAFLSIWIQLPAFILSVTEITDWAVRKLPPLRIEHSELSLIKAESLKYLIDLEELSPIFGKDFYCLIDPAQSGEDSKDPFGLLLKKDKIIFKDRQGVKIFPYPKELSVTVTSFTLVHWRDVLLWLSPIYLFLRTFLNLIVLNGFEILFFAILGFLGVRIFKKNLPWKICFSVAAVAITPALTLAFVLELTGLYFPILSFALLGLYLLYFIKGLSACVRSFPQNSDPEVVYP